MILGGRYQIGDAVAVEWNPEMAQRFPDADHHGCRQLFHLEGEHWAPHDPPRCVGWHCPNCGAATGSFGHSECSAVAQ